MDTQLTARRRRLARAVVALVIVAGCGIGESSAPTTPSAVAAAPSEALTTSAASALPSGSPVVSPVASATEAPAASLVQTPTAAASPTPPASAVPPSPPPASSARTATAAPSPTTAAACPARGSVITVDRLLTLGTACVWLDYRVRGWWDTPRLEDGLPDGIFGTVLRGSLPVHQPAEGGVAYRAGLPVDAAAVPSPFAGFDGQWVEVTVQAVPHGREPHCSWVFGEDGATGAAPPTWSCPAYGEVRTARIVVPPPAALRNCPSTSGVLPVDVFVRYPRACFGSKSVQLSGWLNTWYVIGGWESSWTIEPAWLWSMGIGELAMLSPAGVPGFTGNVRLHIRPGSPMASARQQRWVILTGHYANPAEVASCRVIDGPGMQTGDRPSTVEARQDCANAFVATGVRTGQPG